MKIKYSLLALALGLVYAVILEFAPDFPLSPEVLLSLVVYVLLKLGVEIVDDSVLKRFRNK